MFTGIAATWWSLRSCMIVSTSISFKNLIYWFFGCLLRHVIIDQYNLRLRINIINFLNAGWLWSVFCYVFLLVFFHNEGWSSSDESTANFFLCFLTWASVSLALEACCCSEDFLFECCDSFGGGLFKDHVACLELGGIIEVLEIEFGLSGDCFNLSDHAKGSYLALSLLRWLTCWSLEMTNGRWHGPNNKTCCLLQEVHDLLVKDSNISALLFILYWYTSFFLSFF